MHGFRTIALIVCAAAALTAGAVRVAGDGTLDPALVARIAAPGAPERYAALEAELTKPTDELGPPASAIRLPAQSFPDGRTKTLVLADLAWFSEDLQTIRIKELRVEQYAEDGTLEGTLEADNAVVDRQAMLAVADGAVRLSMADGDRLTGWGAYCDLKDSYVRILRDAVIHTSKIGQVDFSDRGQF